MNNLSKQFFIKKIQQFIDGNVSQEELIHWFSRYDFGSNDYTGQYSNIIIATTNFINNLEIEDLDDSEVKIILQFLLNCMNEEFIAYNSELIFTIAFHSPTIQRLFLSRILGKISLDDFTKFIKTHNLPLEASKLNIEELKSLYSELEAFKIPKKLLDSSIM